MLYTPQQGDTRGYEYFQFGFQFRADNKGVFLIGSLVKLTADKGSKTYVPIDGFEVGDNRIIIASVQMKVPCLLSAHSVSTGTGVSGAAGAFRVGAAAGGVAGGVTGTVCLGMA